MRSVYTHEEVVEYSTRDRVGLAVSGRDSALVEPKTNENYIRWFIGGYLDNRKHAT